LLSVSVFPMERR